MFGCPTRAQAFASWRMRSTSARCCSGSSAEVVAQELHGDVAVEHEVAREKDATHGAAPEQPLDAVAPDARGEGSLAGIHASVSLSTPAGPPDDRPYALSRPRRPRPASPAAGSGFFSTRGGGTPYSSRSFLSRPSRSTRSWYSGMRGIWTKTLHARLGRDDLDAYRYCVSFGCPVGRVAEDEVRGVRILLDDLVAEIDAQVAKGAAVGLGLGVARFGLDPGARPADHEQERRGRETARSDERPRAEHHSAANREPAVRANFRGGGASRARQPRRTATVSPIGQHVAVERVDRADALELRRAAGTWRAPRKSRAERRRRSPGVLGTTMPSATTPMIAMACEVADRAEPAAAREHPPRRSRSAASRRAVTSRNGTA